VSFLQESKKEKKKKRERESVSELEDFEEAELKAASELLNAEAAHVRSAMGHADVRATPDLGPSWGTAKSRTRVMHAACRTLLASHV
jgi:pre-mRNA splicing factor component